MDIKLPGTYFSRSEGAGILTFFVQPSSSKLPDPQCGLPFSPIPYTESPSPETPGLTINQTYSPSTTDSSSETRTVQIMFEDNVIPSGNLSQP